MPFLIEYTLLHGSREDRAQIVPPALADEDVDAAIEELLGAGAVKTLAVEPVEAYQIAD